jgi:hypothetical protein
MIVLFVEFENEDAGKQRRVQIARVYKRETRQQK